MRSFSERLEVDKLIARGASDYAIAAITGVPRGTVGHWRRHPDRGPREVEPPERWRPSDPAAYAYLLGLYLGDGCLAPRGSPLMIALDARYPGIVDSAQAAIEHVVSGIAVHRYHPKENLVRVVASSPLWPRIFPQHGPGRKHMRRIELVDLQNDKPVQGRAAQRSRRRVPVSPLLLLEPVRRHPADLLRSLRTARDSMDSVESPEHLDFAPDFRRVARRVHRPEVVSGIQGGCELSVD